MTNWIKSFFINDYFIASCAGAWYASTRFLTDSSFTLVEVSISILFFCSTLIIYNLDRLFGDHWTELKGFLVKPSFNSISKKVRANLAFQGFFSIILLLALFHTPIHVIKLLFVPFLASFFYAMPILPGRRRLRDLPFLKIFLIAFVWSWISVVPAFETTEMGIEGWTMVAARFLFIYGITIPFDTRDLSADMKSNVPTIPHRVGTKKALASATLSLLLSMFLAFWFSTPDYMAHCAASVLALAIVMSWKADRPYLYYLLGLDGCILLHSCFIVGFKHLLS